MNLSRRINELFCLTCDIMELTTLMKSKKWYLVLDGCWIDETESCDIHLAALDFIFKHDLKESPVELTEHIIPKDEYDNFNPSLVPKKRFDL